MAPTSRRILSLSVDSVQQVLMVHHVEAANQSVSQSVRLGVEPDLMMMTRF